jgi:hypothetical protein
MIFDWLFKREPKYRIQQFGIWFQAEKLISEDKWKVLESFRRREP